MFVSINTKEMRVIAACATIDQAHAHADIKCRVDNFIIIDPSEYNWKVFNASELSVLYCNTCGRKLTASDVSTRRRYVRDVLVDLELDDTPLETLEMKRPSLKVIHGESDIKTPGGNTVKGTSSKSVVYKLMNLLWAENGHPGDVKQLRIDLMNQMGVSHPEIKRTTISTTLGGWQKEYIK